MIVKQRKKNVIIWNFAYIRNSPVIDPLSVTDPLHSFEREYSHASLNLVLLSTIL